MIGGVSVFSVILLFFCFRQRSPFIYQTNDDLFLKMLVSGEMCGICQTHLFHISYPVGVLLSGLYKLFPKFPWYGLFFCLVIGLVMAIILRLFLLLENSLLIRLVTLLLFMFFSYGFLFLHIAELQFTVVAAIAGCGALFVFVLAPEADSYRKVLKNNIGFLLLSACALCIRNQVFFMFLPFVGMIGFGKYLDAGKERARKCLIFLAGVFALMLIFLCAVEKLAYRGEDWRIFSAYNKARANIYDYEGFPDYDAYKTIYQELGISRSSYEAAAHHYSIALESNIDQKSMEVLEFIVKQERHLSYTEIWGKLQEMAVLFVERHLSYADRPLNLLVYSCYILFFICGILCRKKDVLRDIVFLGIARMFIWAYLLFYGRLPVRVSQSVYLAEFAVLLAIAFRSKVWELREVSGNMGIQKGTLARGFWSISIIFLTFDCFCIGFPKAKAVAAEASSRLQFSQAFVDIRDYFHAHPDKFYYLDMNSFSYFTEDALGKNRGQYDNFLYLGSWMPHSPWYELKFNRAGISHPAEALYEDPNVYVVFMNAESIDDDYLQDFYDENYSGVSLKIVERVDVSNGLQFLVMKGYAE